MSIIERLKKLQDEIQAQIELVREGGFSGDEENIMENWDFEIEEIIKELEKL
jgi:hypothetical protein